MLNRRLIRIKVYQALYASAQDAEAEGKFYERQLQNNLQRIYDIYLFILAFPIDLKHIASLELEMQEAKHFPDSTEIRLHQALTQNSFINLLENHPGFAERRSKLKMSWEPFKDSLRNIFVDIKKDETFRKYALEEFSQPPTPRKLVQHLLNQVVSENEVFNSHLEEQYISWTDDREAILNELNKSLRLLKDPEADFMARPDGEHDELATFARDLFVKTRLHDRQFEELISTRTRNWDVERIALTDTILMKMAICEMLYFPSIPVKVSINEYLEISKNYSTPNSKSFINGVLDAIQKELRTAGSIHKEGRGLME